MRRRLAVALAVAAPAAMVATTGQAQEPVPDAPVPPPAAVPTPVPPPAPLPRLVRSRFLRPAHRVVLHRRFVPWAQPSPSQTQTIINLEAARAGVSAAGLSRRVACESGYRWWAANGQYHGLGQFASETFYRGMSTIGSRKVVLVSSTSRLRRVREQRVYSDGHVVIARRGFMRQAVERRTVGWIPRSPVMTHGWAQIRIMAQVLAGRSAVHNSEWECGA